MGNNSAAFIFASFLNMGQCLNERINTARSKIFPLRVDLLLEGFGPPKKQTEIHQSCLPLKQWPNNIVVFPYTLTWFL